MVVKISYQITEESNNIIIIQYYININKIMVSRFKLSNKLYTKHKNKYKSSIQTYKPNEININIIYFIYE